MSVLTEDLLNGRLIISANDKFITNEIIEGQDSKFLLQQLLIIDHNQFKIFQTL